MTWLSTLQTDLEKKIYGQSTLIEEALVCILANGHMLMTGAPGLAKTTLVKSLAFHLQLRSGRIQFTPDVMPSDITGSDVLDQTEGQRSFRFIKGPVFCNLLLADEINRASPRSQSALLEAMQERTVTVGLHTHKLPNPFVVFATQNPFETEGTFVLPEAQMDRFMLHSLIDYPDSESEKKILLASAANQLVNDALPFEDLSTEKILTAQREASLLPVSSSLIDGIVQLVRSTREKNADLLLGAGPRAGIALLQAAKAIAYLKGKTTVQWEDVTRMTKPVLRHRVKKSSEAWRAKKTEDEIIAALLKKTEEHFIALGRGLSTHS